mmetsp:Transcript_6303/g.9695  ORF Transcript_6303/g.9695 Transcript_6303/m.9695 type:complete len:490 (-) Transcript_6303:306-1775(-)
MTPRQQRQQSDSDDDDKGKNSTVVHHTPDGAPYVICDSKESFVNPTTTTDETTITNLGERNEKTLNLDLGQSLIVRSKMKWFLVLLRLMDKLALVEWWETYFFALWKAVPLRLRRGLTFQSWSWYVKFHSYVLGRRTGLHPSQSLEYHALTTIIWWSRFFPVTPQRIRFSLSQLSVCTPAIKGEAVFSVEEIQEDQKQYLLEGEKMTIPQEQMEHCTVRGLLLNRKRKNNDESNDHTLFWIYGGAYLGGDSEGNAPAATYVGKETDAAQVFIPTSRLAPEATMDDVLWDIVLAYQWICRRMKKKEGSTKITLAGVSSGGALTVRLMQLIAEYQRGETLLPSYVASILPECYMPHGAVMLGPYVDYTKEKKGSFLHHPRLDLIVTEAVQENGLPYLETFIPKHGSRKDYSPVYRSMKGLPPMLVLISEHEAVYDMAMELVNRARADQVLVTVGVWKYMCHVFTLLYGFIPEGQQSMNVLVEWIRRRTISS